MHSNTGNYFQETTFSQTRNQRAMKVQATVRPVEILQRYMATLHAAILSCRRRPDKRHVHRTRTTTRRIEAQMILLDMLDARSSRNRSGPKAARLLKKIRRAAGRVRDFDVLCDLIAGHAPSKAQAEGEKLSRVLQQQRIEAAEELMRTLDKLHAKLTRALGALLAERERAEPIVLGISGLTALTENWFAQNAPAPDDDPDRLHAIRKKAKIARYMAENAPKPARPARSLARVFEEVQALGGHWHDWLVLAEIARSHMGESSPLVKSFARLRDEAYVSYRKKLSGLQIGNTRAA